MNTSVTLTAIYVLTLLIWFIFIILALRVIKSSKNFTKKLVPLAVIFFTISFVLIGLSLYFFMSAQGQISSSITTSTSSPY